MQAGSDFLPQAFLKNMESVLGAELEDFLHSLTIPAPVSVRLNPYKMIRKFDGAEQIAWCPNGRFLTDRPSFTFDPLFHAGTYYVQEASSMFLEQIWKRINPDNQTVCVLDMCAAPGGKSTHLLSLMNDQSILVTNEIIPNRNKVLQQNVVKWGMANCIVSQNKPEDFSDLEDYFDIVLVDAPCSGEGLFRKDKDAIEEWSEKNVQMCSLRQKDIIKHAIACLKPGGFLIYSTCTFEPDENDNQIANSGLQVAELEQQNFGQTKTKYGHQFFPHKIKGEGFYISVLQKEGNWSPGRQQAVSGKPNAQFLALAGQYLEHNQFIPYSKNEFLFAFPESIYTAFRYLESHLYIRHAGIFMGSIKGKDFIPSHDLALSNVVKRDLPAWELDYELAIAYLRCEVPKFNTDLRGWVLAKYEGMNLGWMKVLEGRINNYFPKDWRILKQA